MNREIKIMGNSRIKFRVWDNVDYMSTPFDLMDLQNKKVQFTSDCIVMQFTGLKDKNGKEIYEGDLLQCKYSLGDNEGWYVDAIYEVLTIRFSGLELHFRGIYDKKDDNCQIPVSQNASFKQGQLCVDYRNANYGHIAFEDTNGENSMSRRMWKENHYSNDIEIIGNIHENPELLK